MRRDSSPALIADKYSLYKKLVKAAAEGETFAQASTSASNGKRSSSSVTAVQLESEATIVSTPRESSLGLEGVRKESPFQTPKKNKTSDRWRRPTNPGEEGRPKDIEVPPISNNPFLSPAKRTAQTPSLLSSLKKAKSYPTPVSDPKHGNPFEDDVVENKEQGTPRKRGVEGDAFKSPSKQAFLFAPSPKRLKSLLEVNSLHASSSSRDPQRSTSVFASPLKSTTLPSITPRTRARKRLRGEEVDDTPEKDREREGKSLKIGSRWAQARSLRLQRSSGGLGDDAARDGVNGEGKDPQSVKRINVWKRSVQEETMSQPDQGAGASGDHVSDDDDETLGPTPVKPTANPSNMDMTSGKRLFVDILPPLDATSHRRAPPTFSKQAADSVAPTLPNEMNEPQLREADLDLPEGITRTPSKAMSRFMAMKPKSTGSPHTMHVDSGTVGDDAPQAMEVVDNGLPLAAVERSPVMRDLYVEPDASDTDDEVVPVETIDIEDFKTGDDDTEPQQKCGPSEQSLAKEIVLSDEEGEGQGRHASDEDHRMDDGDAEPVPRRPKKLRIESYRYTLQQKVAQQRTKRKHNLFDENDFEEMQGNEDEDGDEELGESAPNQPDPFQALSQLSIRSPESKVIRKTMALQEARAKAIFDGRARERLRAAKRAPVYGAGEGMGRGIEDGEGYGGQSDPFVDEGDDDDWESDAEGWKATGLPDDDDW